MHCREPRSVRQVANEKLSGCKTHKTRRDIDFICRSLTDFEIKAIPVAKLTIASVCIEWRSTTTE